METVDIREPVLFISERMELRLRKHDADWGFTGWRDPKISTRFLYERIRQKTIEALYYQSHGDKEKLINKLTDACNFAMMIIDRTRMEDSK